MISQYHEVISEAKKNPETLEYVRENFSEIFKETKEKWQELRDEIEPVNESKIEKDEEIKNTDVRIEEIEPETTDGKLKIEKEEINKKQKEEERKYELKKQEELIKRLEENIEHGQRQKESYSDILNQRVEYTREQYASGEARVISDDAREFTDLWRQFPVNPLVMSVSQGDYMVKELKNKNYTDEDIESYKQKREKLKEVQKKIETSLQESNSRASSIGFARSNDINYRSFPYIEVGHGNHYIDNSLLGKQMTLGELLDKDINIKTKELGEAKEKLQEIVKES